MTINAKKLSKWFLGLGILIGFVLFSLNLFENNVAIALFLLIGLGLGYVESRSEIGIASGYMDFFITGSRKRLYGLLLLFGVGTLATLGIHFQAAINGAVPEFQASSSQTIIPGTSAVSPVNFGLVLGSFLFGVGLSINEGCGLGTLRNIGQGQLRYVWTLLFLLIGTIPGQFVKYFLDHSPLHSLSVQLYLPNHLGYSGTAIIIMGLLLILALAARKYEQNRREHHTYQPVESHNLPESEEEEAELEPILSKQFLTHVFTTEWARLISVGLITLFLILALVVTGEKLSVTKPLLYPALAIFQNLGFNFSHPAFQEPLSVVQSGLFNDTDTVQNFAILFGALIYSLTSGRFSFSWSMKWEESGYFMLGGLLMGFGAVLAGGCIVGALYSGVVNFSISGWVVFASMSMGIYLTTKCVSGKVQTIPSVK